MLVDGGARLVVDQLDARQFVSRHAVSRRAISRRFDRRQFCSGMFIDTVADDAAVRWIRSNAHGREYRKERRQSSQMPNSTNAMLYERRALRTLNSTSG